LASRFRSASRPITAALLVLPAAVLMNPSPARAQRDPDPASYSVLHGQHRTIECGECHTGGVTRSALDVQWCDGCHHPDPPRRRCTSCHDLSGIAVVARPVPMALPAGPEVRELDFPHAAHSAQGCGSCHTNPPSSPRSEGTCQGCHAEHHGPAVDCSRCHGEVPRWPHDPVLVHSGCVGALCHTGGPGPPLRPETAGAGDHGEGVWWRRNVCAACHPDVSDEGPLPPRPPYLQLPRWEGDGDPPMRIGPALPKSPPGRR
jgi:hypothetical protein